MKYGPFKYPVENKAYGLDWGTELLSGDTIATSSWTVQAGDVTLSGPNFAGAVTQVRAVGGTPGTSAEILNTITTTAGETHSEAIRFPIKDPATP